MGRFNGWEDVEAMSSEELQRYIEAKLTEILALEVTRYVPEYVRWRAERALAAVKHWRHIGTPVALFEVDSVAPRGLHAVDPVER